MTTASRWQLSALALILAAILFLAVNVLANLGLSGARLDLTADRLNTLSEGTKATLAKLDEPVRLKLYYSAKIAADLPRIRAHGQRVKDLLTEYQSRARGHLIVDVIEPEPFSATEDEASQLGLRGVPSETGATFYFGLVGTNQVDGREIIPYFALDRENLIEYDITRLIANLARSKKPVVGLMTDLPLAFGPGGMAAAMRGQSRPYVVYEDLAKQFEIKALPTSAETLDADIKTLLLVHPANLSPQTQFMLDQFVLGGGRLIALVDPLSELALTSPPGPGGQRAAEASDLGPLFKAWGISLKPKVFVGDRQNAQRVVFNDAGQQRQMGYLAWTHLGEDNFNRADPALALLKTLNFASAGAIEITPGATTKIEPLIWSSEDSALIDVEAIATRPDPAALLRDFKPLGQRQNLAVRISGEATTAFPNGAPSPKDAPTDKAGAAKPQALTKSQGPIQVVVIADTDFLDDKFWVQTAELFGQRVPVPSADNGNFLVGLVDNMTGSGEVIALRARPNVARPFTRVEAMRRGAEEKFLTEEKRLQDKLAEAERKLTELNVQGKPGQAAQALGPAELELIAKFQKERAETRAALREVQRKLRADIDRLDVVLKIVNIALVPVLLALFALGLSIHQARQRATRLARLKLADRAA